MKNRLYDDPSIICDWDQISSVSANQTSIMKKKKKSYWIQNMGKHGNTAILMSMSSVHMPQTNMNFSVCILRTEEGHQGNWNRKTAAP